MPPRNPRNPRSINQPSRRRISSTPSTNQITPKANQGWGLLQMVIHRKSSTQTQVSSSDGPCLTWTAIKSVFIMSFILGLVAIVLNIILINKSMEAMGLRADYRKWDEVGFSDAIVIGSFVFSDFYGHLGILICCTNIMWNKMSLYLGFWLTIRLLIFTGTSFLWSILLYYNPSTINIILGLIPLFFLMYFGTSFMFRSGFIKNQERLRSEPPLPLNFRPPSLPAPETRHEDECQV